MLECIEYGVYTLLVYIEIILAICDVVDHLDRYSDVGKSDKHYGSY